MDFSSRRMKLDEDVLSALRRSPDKFANQMRLAAAIDWYTRGDISQEKAAQVPGLDRTDFSWHSREKAKMPSSSTSLISIENSTWLSYG